MQAERVSPGHQGSFLLVIFQKFVGTRPLFSGSKKLVLFPHSGHHPMETDTDSVEDEIINFVDTFK